MSATLSIQASIEASVGAERARWSWNAIGNEPAGRSGRTRSRTRSSTKRSSPVSTVNACTRSSTASTRDRSPGNAVRSNTYRFQAFCTSACRGLSQLSEGSRRYRETENRYRKPPHLPYAHAASRVYADQFHVPGSFRAAPAYSVDGFMIVISSRREAAPSRRTVRFEDTALQAEPTKTGDQRAASSMESNCGAEVRWLSRARVPAWRAIT